MGYIFGPVPSRRLGSSLGVDVVPHKICNLDCVYCEVGKTNVLINERKHFFSLDCMMDEFEKSYNELYNHIDVVTVTGSGEPTMNLELYDIASYLKRKIKHPLVLLTNGIMLHDADVVKAVNLFDIVVPNVDTVDDDIFRLINRPCEDIDLEQVLSGLHDFSHQYLGKLYVEVLIVKGMNDAEVCLINTAEYINSLKYNKVQINTVFRPPAYRGVQGLKDEELIDVALIFKKRGVVVEPVGNYVKQLTKGSGFDISGQIISLLQMRPCTKEDIGLIFEIDSYEFDGYFKNIILKNNVHKYEYNKEIFYKMDK